MINIKGIRTASKTFKKAFEWSKSYYVWRPLELICRKNVIDPFKSEFTPVLLTSLFAIRKSPLREYI